MDSFQDCILEGIPSEIPNRLIDDVKINRAPYRKEILSKSEIKLALRNALRYFPKFQHKFLAKEFLDELNQFQNL